ncbi:DUF4435 domain-containing protein [Pectobacterium parmentieri]|uniref:DUF4435 domain-containing protein n=1 Tax=Pectobacterium parmentieri TaxID=1905730 RepID=A0A8B3F4M4_PECPM|nr:DUF4435 domain-containing protein [Pectobacterium parmentieri]AOR59276.1 hypothetical protein A8F97_10180 [Pectobacterium parmentieri]AYH09710.1 DUF4435 domain-containing protein [Pectobacterium parmentieri]AYH19581.1 DUF4435 domain-containing protein [Pectobacterium parmentieri]AZS56091.1 DUF4435 domain-containing protein [Pectobacterium parmentieri]RKO75716.1 DUF4435 domain-containing protein [Pectobacterium parmentieri]
MTSSLTYSVNALNILHAFHSGNKIVFVEGDSDKRFWDGLYNSFGINNITTKCVNGCKVIDEYIEKIKEGATGVYVARDRDYKYLFDEPEDLINVMFSYGYSIENTYYTDDILKGIVKSLAAKDIPDDYISIDRDIIKPNINLFFKLVSFDYALFSQGVGEKIMGDSSFRFLEKQDGFQLCKKIVEPIILNAKGKIDYSIYLSYRKKLIKYKGEPLICVRGHFLTGMISNYIKEKVKNASGSKITYDNKLLESIFSNLMNINLRDDVHPHKEYYYHQVSILKK